MLILAFVHALELKLHNIGKPVIDLRDLSTFAPLTRAPHPVSCTFAPLTRAPHPASCTFAACGVHRTLLAALGWVGGSPTKLASFWNWTAGEVALH